MTRTSHAVPGPDNITRVQFKNGMTVLVRENHAAPVVVLEGSLPVGSIFDPPERAGLSSFVTSMLTRGSTKYNFDLFNENIESVGASLAVGNSTLSVDFSTTCLNEDFPLLVDVLADVLRYPTFPEPHIERVHDQKLVNLKERSQDTGRMASLRFYETLYGRIHPYGRSGLGYLETVSEITREDIEQFHTQRYTPNGSVVVVVGDVQADAVIELLEAQFGDWQGPKADLSVTSIEPVTSKQRVVVPIPDKAQSDIMLGCLGVARSHPDYDAMRVANTILGRFGMMGRLGEEVREKRGLAYYCYSSLDAEFDAGSWHAIAGVNPENVQQAIDSILGEFKRLGDESVSAEDLADSQAYMTGVLPIGLETNAGVAQTLLNMEWLDLGLDYLERYNEIIYSITPEDIQQVARKYLKEDRTIIVVAGPENK